MAAAYRWDISKAGSRAGYTELKRHWYERGECLFTVSVETCNTVSFFFSRLKSCISHYPPSPWVNSLLYRSERRQIRFPMASASLVSSPPTPVLDKNMSDCEVEGDERSSNILIQFLMRSSVRCLRCCFSFINNQTQSVKTSPPPHSNKLCMPLWSIYVDNIIHVHFHAG